jgi:hypothetical protein
MLLTRADVSYNEHYFYYHYFFEHKIHGTAPSSLDWFKLLTRTDLLYDQHNAYSEKSFDDGLYLEY